MNAFPCIEQYFLEKVFAVAAGPHIQVAYFMDDPLVGFDGLYELLFCQ
jgi:D-mannonate dehydratase